ncbi:MAG: radical SAM protein [Bdellovibrionales bacterium]
MSEMEIDEQFYQAFNNKIGQVFMYLTDTCNLRCVQCLYKPELTFQLQKKEMEYGDALNLMKNMRELGAIKMTFMGGEPTLYKKLPELIHEAKQMGYSHVRIDTNGMFNPSLLDNPYFRELDEITFSLDGYTEEMNDAIRGKGSFKNCTSNIKKAIEKGYNVHVTSCVHKGLTAQAENGQLALINMIEFMKGLGVKTLNMHDLFKGGIPRDVWSNNINTSVKEYMEAFAEVQKYKETEKGIDVRMPQCVTVKEEFERNKEYYGYCSAKQFDRILAFPNGMLRLCSLMIGTPYGIGFYDSKKIYWNNTPTNELLGHDMTKDTPCTNQNKGNHFGEFVPLCVSFKPRQNEPVWLKKLQWEKKRKEGPAP